MRWQRGHCKEQDRIDLLKKIGFWDEEHPSCWATQKEKAEKRIEEYNNKEEFLHDKALDSSANSKNTLPPENDSEFLTIQKVQEICKVTREDSSLLLEK